MKLLAIVISFVSTTVSVDFVFVPADSLISPSSWADSVVPCETDKIHFDQGKKVVTVLDGSLSANEILLPDNGIIYFGERVSVGQRGNWQCSGRGESKGRLFSVL